MKKVQFTREERIINALMIHSFSLSDMGFLHGKMGVVLYFFYLGRAKNNSVFTSFAEELLDNVVESLHNELPIDFDRGITGIGWAVEHLIQNGYVEADADDVLEEIDMRVKQNFIHNELSFEQVVSVGFYLASRISYRKNDDDSEIVLNIKHQLILLIDELERQISLSEHSKHTLHLINTLDELHVFDYKIEKLKALVADQQCDYLLPFIPRILPSEIETIFSSKDVKSEFAGFQLKNTPRQESFGLRDGIAGFGLQKIVSSYDL